MIGLIGVVVMLLEPVIVFTKTEYVPSTILVLRDNSESMDLKDAYASAAYAERLAQALNLTGGAKELRETMRWQLVDRVMNGGLAKSLTSGGDRVLASHGFAGQLLSDSTTQLATQPAATQAAMTPPAAADRTTTAIGTAIRQAIAASRGQPLAGMLLIRD